MNYEQLLLTAALIKWQMGEPMSVGDLRRINQLLAQGQLGLDQINPDVAAGLQNQMIDTLQQWMAALKK